MARISSKKSLSKEQLLADMLIPIEDQPNKLPLNWTWVTLDSVANYKKGPFGSAITKAMFVAKGDNTYKVYEQGNAIRKTVSYGEYYISGEKYQELIGFSVKPGDLIVSCAGTIGETYQLPSNCEEGVINQALMRVRVSSNIILKYYLYYFDVILRQDITGKAKGSAMNNIPPFAVLKKLPFPLPPLAEQQRIVDRIESLFAKLDEVKEKLEAVVDSYETRKAAILHKAFSGKLTRKWRKSQDICYSSWNFLPLKDCSRNIGDGLHGTPVYDESGSCYFINGNNLNGREIVIKNSTKCINDTEYEKYKVELSPETTILLSINGTLGNTAFYKGEYVVLGKSACYINVLENLQKEFLRYYFESKEFIDYANEKATGTTIKNLGLKAIRNMVVPVPSIQEQKHIVQILDKILNRYYDIILILNIQIANVDLLKKSILVRAFRGELGTNRPEEESSIELLKDILSQT